MDELVPELRDDRPVDFPTAPITLLPPEDLSLNLPVPPALIPVAERKRKRKPIGKGAFAKTPEGRRRQLANLQPRPVNLTRRSVLLRGRNGRRCGTRSQPSIDLTLKNPCWSCTLPVCSVPAGQKPTYHCRVHLLTETGAGSSACQYLVSGRCLYRSKKDVCYLQPGAEKSPNHDQVQFLALARRNVIRIGGFKDSPRTREPMRLALEVYQHALSRVLAEEEVPTACRYIHRLPRVANDLSAVDPNLLAGVRSGAVPLRGAEILPTGDDLFAAMAEASSFDELTTISSDLARRDKRVDSLQDDPDLARLASGGL